jgi:hypothetical protein
MAQVLVRFRPKSDQSSVKLSLDAELVDWNSA